MVGDHEGVLADVGRHLRDTDALNYIHIAGLALIHLGKEVDGIDWLCASLSLTQAEPEWFVNAAIATMDKKLYSRAMMFLENGVKEHPDHVKIRFMRGLTHIHLRNWSEAVKDFDHVLSIDPGYYHANLSKGFVLHMLGQYTSALKCYDDVDRATTPLDTLEEIDNNIVCVMIEQGAYKQALELIEDRHLVSIRHGTLFNKALLMLGLGKWPDAWAPYRHRFHVQETQHDFVKRVDQPMVNSLSDLRGRNVLFYHEQGFGDTLQFVRYARMIAEHASHVTIGVPQKLVRLLQTLDLGVPYSVVTTIEETAYCTVSVPMLDAPFLFQTTLDTIPATVPYLSVPAAVAEQRQLPDNGRPRIGLVWAGAARPDNLRANAVDRRRSMPFEEMRHLLFLSDRYDFISLQLEDHRVADRRLFQPLDNSFDMLDTAAIVDQLDLVITIDSAVAHLAGALGKRVWLLSRFDACWRWLWDGRDTSPWYPTMKIFRQSRPGDWTSVLRNVHDELRTIS